MEEREGVSCCRQRPGNAQALCDLGWLPIDWNTTGCGRTESGGCGLTGEGRDTDQSAKHAAIFTSLILFFSLSPWNECDGCGSSVAFAAEGGLGTDSSSSEKIRPTHRAITTAARLLQVICLPTLPNVLLFILPAQASLRSSLCIILPPVLVL